MRSFVSNFDLRPLDSHSTARSASYRPRHAGTRTPDVGFDARGDDRCHAKDEPASRNARSRRVRRDLRGEADPLYLMRLMTLNIGR